MTLWRRVPTWARLAMAAAIGTPATITGQLLWGSVSTILLFIGFAVIVIWAEERRQHPGNLSIAVAWLVVGSFGQVLVDRWFTAGPWSQSMSFAERVPVWAIAMLGVSICAAAAALYGVRQLRRKTTSQANEPTGTNGLAG